MADGTTTPQAPAPSAPAPAGQPSAPTVPDGYRQIPVSEYETLSRNSARVSGMDSFVRSARELGFEKPEDFASWKDTFGTFKKRGLTPRQLNEVFSDRAVQQDSGEDQRPAFDPDRFRKELSSEFEFKIAEKDHRTAFDREKDLIDAAVSDLTDENTSAFEKKRWGLALRSALDDARDLYPENHPLREKYVVQPLTKAHSERVVAAFKKELEAEKGAALASKGDAVRKSDRVVPTAAQPGTRQGKPETNSNSGPRDRLRDAIDNAKQKLNITS